jgi:hypothetical protein
MINVNICLTVVASFTSGWHPSGAGTYIRMAHWKGSYVDPLAGGWSVLGFYMTWGSCI